MAVAFDASSESHTGTTGSTSEASFTWTHTPVGTPRGVLVFVYQNTATDVDEVTSVTYGGTSMTAVSGGRAKDTAGELGAVKAYFLGASVPTGAQSVVVNRNNTTNALYAIAHTVTAAGNTSTYDAGIVLLQEDGTIAEQNVDDGSPGTNSVRFAGAYAGGNGVPAAGANSTATQSIDLGPRTFAAVRETTAGQGSRAVGFSEGVSDDRAVVHVAVYQSSTDAAATAKTLAALGVG